MDSITLNAPAKINLYLEVINKRSDGYHNIETIFQKIALSDRVKVSIVKKGIVIDSACPHIPRLKGNIAYKAALLMKREFGLTQGISISIDKNIPVAAGLGGGSSDAACVIKAIDTLFKLKIPPKKLNKIAKAIGADVPFFVSGYSCALAKGIGERLTQIRHNLVFYVILLIPNLKLYTKYIYKKIRLPLTRQSSDVRMLTHAIKSNRDKKVGQLLYNRLEEVILPNYPAVSKAKQILSASGAEGILVSGSGSSLFALFRDRKEAVRARDSMSVDRGWQLFLTRTI